MRKDKLIARFDKFAAGQWQELLRASAKCAEDAANCPGGKDGGTMLQRNRGRPGH